VEGGGGEMKLFLRRFLAYLCLSLFLALAAGPFTGTVELKGIKITKQIPVCRMGPAGSVRTMNIIVPVKRRIAWFDPVRFSLALVFCLLGLWLMRGMARSGPGIPLTPPWAIHLSDGIFIFFLAAGVFFIMDGILTVLFNTIPVFRYDRVIFNIMALGYIPVTAFCAWFASRQLGQGIEIKADKITLYSSGKSTPIPWKNIRGFDLKETWTVTGRGGVLMPGKMQTKLIIQAMPESVTVVEPGLKRIKAKIIRALKEKSPPVLQEDINKIAEKW